MENLPSQTGNTRVIRWNEGQKDYYSYLSREGKSVKDDEIGYYIKLLKNKKLSILVPIFIIVPLVALGTFLEKPIYKSTTTLLIENITPHIIPSQDMVTPKLSLIDYTTEFEIIKSRAILEEVIDKLGLDKIRQEEVSQEENSSYIAILRRSLNYLKGSVRYFKAKIFEYIVNKTDQDSQKINRENTILSLQKSMKVIPKEMTKIVDIAISGHNPQQVAQIANTLAEIYIRENLDEKLQETRKANAWLKNETEKLKEKMNNSESDLQSFREKRRVISFDINQDNNISLKKLTDLNSLYILTKKERIELESNINQIRKVSSGNSTDIKSGLDILNSPVIINLTNTYLDLKSQLASLEEIYKNKHLKIAQITSQISQTEREINSEINKILEGLNIKYKSVLSKEISLEKEIAKQKNETINIDNDLVEYSALKREADINREMYLAISKKLRESELAEALEINNIKVIQPASIPLFPEPSGTMLKIFGSIIIGLSFGVGYVFVNEYLDKRFKKPNEVEEHLQVPFLGIIPHFKVDKRRMYEPIALHDPGSSVAEAYRILRTRTHLSSMQPVKTLLVTSAIPGEGKSTTSVNLGISFAQLGLKVLLVDADLRHPSLHHAFHISEEIGLTDILLHGADWQKVLQETKMENLKILPTGMKPHNPSELLSMNKMRQLIGSFKNNFDIVILDAPVVLSVPDVEIVSPEIDGVLLVHDLEKSNKELAIEAKRILERAGAHIVGIVFNNVKEYLYYYGQYSKHNVNKKDKNKRTPDFIDMRPIEKSNVLLSNNGSI